MHPKPLDDVQDVNLQVKLLFGVLLHPVFAPFCRSAAEAALGAKMTQSKASTVLVGKELPVNDCLVQAPLQTILKVLDGFLQIFFYCTSLFIAK